MYPDDSSPLSALLSSVSHCASLLQIPNSQLSKMKSMVLGDKERFFKKQECRPKQSLLLFKCDGQTLSHCKVRSINQGVSAVRSTSNNRSRFLRPGTFAIIRALLKKGNVCKIVTTELGTEQIFT